MYNIEFVDNFFLENKEDTYKKFSEKLNPNQKNIIGVRIPIIKDLGKKIVKENNFENIYNNLNNKYFENIMLKGIMIGYLKLNIEEILCYTKDFVNLIDNWSICDSFCFNLKIVEKNQEEFFKFAKKYLFLNEQYKIRFGVVILLRYFVNDKYINEIIKFLDKINVEFYYSHMSVAWLVSVMYKKYPDKTINYLKKNKLEIKTHNKSIQKAKELKNVSKEEKEILNKLKRN